MEASEQPETTETVSAPAESAPTPAVEETPAPQPAAETEPETEPVSDVVDDGVHDVEPNAAVIGDWLDIVKGEYSGRHAVYLDNVGDGTILVRTRDADNLTVEVAYADVRKSAYLGGR